MVVTGYVKSYSLKEAAPNTTPRFAKKWIMYAYPENHLSIEKSRIPHLPKDGWSNPFYYYDKHKILLSAGKDERFGTKDDLIFPIFTSACTDEMQVYILQKLKNLKPNLPENTHFLKSSNSLIKEKNICSIPDLSMFDNGIIGKIVELKR